MRVSQRIALAATGLLAAASLPVAAVATAAPAQAGGYAERCMNYVESQGYEVTDTVRKGCESAEANSFPDGCYDMLTFLADIPGEVAGPACRLGTSPER